MQVTVDAIRALREETGAGIMDCKRALEQAGGDHEKALQFLAEKGIAAAAKKASRATNEGLVEAYIHSGGRIGAIVELNCETDFVARTDDFKELAHDLAMQVAAMSPLFIDTDDMPEGEEHDPQQVCLVQQPYIRDQTRTVQDLLNDAVGKLGENVRVRRFARFSLGE
jgi:elongation factor Ts